MRRILLIGAGLCGLWACSPTTAGSLNTSTTSGSGSSAGHGTTGNTAGNGNATNTASNTTGSNGTPSTGTNSGTTSGPTTNTSNTNGTNAANSSTTNGTTTGSCCDALGCENLGETCDSRNCTCVAPASTSTSTGTGTTGTTSTSSTTGSSICTTQRCVVYASDDHTLYQVDPTNPGSLQQLCAFGGALNSTSADTVTDIAVTPDGVLYAITETHLYTVDPQTCSATQQATLSTSNQRYVGLAFTAGGVLVAADETGDVETIDTSTGQVSQAGTFGGTLACSGDIVAIDDTSQTIFATAVDTSCTSSSCTDKLVTLDPSTFQATVVGDIGYKQVYGLGYWAGQLYGFSRAGQTLQIDPTSGQATVLQTNSTLKFSGAGMTPLAPTLNH
jgi:hypothetical protein